MAQQNLSKWQKQNQFIDVLTQEGSIEAACARIGIARATYYKWLKDEEFQKKIEDKKFFIFNHSIDDMVKMFEYAIGAYNDLIFSNNESIRLRTATAIFRNVNNIINTKYNADQYQDWVEMRIDTNLRILDAQKENGARNGVPIDLWNNPTSPEAG